MKLIGITGHLHAGKDTIFELLRSLLTRQKVYRFAFGDPLKREVLRALRGAGWGGNFDTLTSQKEVFRPLLQWWGTEFRRGMFGTNYWVERMEEQLDGSRADVAVITDVRFTNEAHFVWQHGGVIVRVLRSSDGDAARFPSADLARPLTALHSSETEQGLIQADYLLANDRMEDLRAQVAELWQKIQQREAKPESLNP
jgi:hypothetical protein